MDRRGVPQLVLQRGRAQAALRRAGRPGADGYGERAARGQRAGADHLLVL